MMISRDQERKEQMSALIKLGNECKKNGDCQKAVILYKKVLEFESDAQLTAEECGMLADTQHNLGNIYTGLHEWLSAREAYEHCIKLLGRTRDKSLNPAECHQLATIHDSLANICIELNEHASAIHHYLKAIAAESGAKKSEDDHFKLLTRISDGYEALLVLLSAQMKEQMLDDSVYRDIACYFKTLAHVYLELKKLPKALEHYNKAIEMRTQIAKDRFSDDDYRELMKCQRKAGIVLKEMGNLPEAMRYCCDAMNSVTQIKVKGGKDLQRAEKVYSILSNLYEPYENFFKQIAEVKAIREALASQSPETPAASSVSEMDLIREQIKSMESRIQKLEQENLNYKDQLADLRRVKIEPVVNAAPESVISLAAAPTLFNDRKQESVAAMPRRSRRVKS
jgi:tetratricopeptide (TPR) repeat protein